MDLRQIPILKNSLGDLTWKDWSTFLCDSILKIDTKHNMAKKIKNASIELFIKLWTFHTKIVRMEAK
jgi:hypothetical protein